MEVVRRAWAVLLAEPAMGSVWILSIWVAVASTCLSVIAARTLAAWLWRRPNREWISILLAVPHGAVALGLLWLMAPSGLLMRWLAIPLDVLSPPDWAFPQDTWGIGLILALTVKEALFLTVMAFAVLARLPFQSQAPACRQFGLVSRSFFSSIVVAANSAETFGSDSGCVGLWADESRIDGDHVTGYSRNDWSTPLCSFY